MIFEIFRDIWYVIDIYDKNPKNNMFLASERW